MRKTTVAMAAMRKAVPSLSPPGLSRQPSSAAWSVASCWSSPSAAPANSTRCACSNAGEDSWDFCTVTSDWSLFLLVICQPSLWDSDTDWSLQVVWDSAFQSGGRAAEEGGPALLRSADCTGADPTSWGLSGVFWESGTWSLIINIILRYSWRLLLL